MGKFFAEEIAKFNKDIEVNFQISIDDLPEKHNAVRKIKNLFNDCIKSYEIIKKLNNPNINASVSITVTHENCSNIKEIFYYFTEDCKIDSIKCCLVRDEGVYTRPKEKVE